MHLCTLVFLFYIVSNKNVPTYLIQVAVYIPIELNLDVFHTVKSLVYSTLEPILINTNRDASTLTAAASNCALKLSKLPKSFIICSINDVFGLVGIAGPIFSKKSSCKITPEPKKLKF